LSTVGQKTAVKVYYPKKMLPLFDILRGQVVFDSREGAAKPHFSRQDH
jgi:hypothetical protein